MKFAKYVLGAALLALTASPASAYDWNHVVQVTVIEVSYLPNRVVFQVDTDVGNCASGAWLNWYPRGTTDVEKSANSQAVLAALMNAKVTNSQIRIFGINAGCTVQYMHLI